MFVRVCCFTYGVCKSIAERVVMAMLVLLACQWHFALCVTIFILDDVVWLNIES